MSSLEILLVNQFLNWRCYEDATTLAEIIFCKESTDVNATLLAKCFHTSGEFLKAIHVLKTRTLCNLDADAKLIMADSAYKLSRYAEVEQIFDARCTDLDFLANRFGNLALPIIKLLGDSYRRRNRIDQAIECYRHCLLSAPYMLSALKALAELGDNFVDRHPDLLTTANVKRVLATSTNVKLDIKNEPAPYSASSNLISIPDIHDENFSNNMHAVPKAFRQSTCKRPSSNEALKTLAPKIQDELIQPDSKALNLQQKRSKVSSLLPRKTRRIISKADSKQISTGTSSVSTENSAIDDNRRNDASAAAISSLKKQRSVIDFGSKDSIKENTKSSVKCSLPIVRGPTTRLQQRKQVSGSVHKLVHSVNMAQCTHSICLLNANNQCIANNSSQSIDELVKVISYLYVIYIHQKRNEFSKVISTFEELPSHLKLTHWALNQKAIAQAELGHYTSALTTFQKIRVSYPNHLESMSIYSSALWHLRAHDDLVHLAQVLSEITLQHPDVWCVVGNHFSISRDHDFAIQMFKRAIQLDPNFAYAYALLGNEYVVSDNHELATSCFRILLHIDIRDYRAWYGLGSICFAREKYQLALLYFQRALDVNPSSTILMCHVAVTQHVRGFTSEALTILTKAVSIDANNSLCRFHRAGMLYTIHNFEGAIKELKVLEELVPNESLVFHMFARVYRKLKNEQMFLTHINWAMKLDAKGVHNTLKDTIGRFYSCEDEHFVEDQTISASGVDSTSNGILSMSRMFQTPLNSLSLNAAEVNACSDSMSLEHRSSASDGEATDC
ncbi:hypothetical protein GJ496_006871 [Pomphorhynchus laevis]|nr:hypothetical protein GJ496_006871 [Pomphorhynchus laevis]